MSHICKQILIILILFSLLIQCGCAKKEFEVIAPPINDFPIADIYEEVKITRGDFIVEKSFRGNKNSDKLVVTSDAQTIKGFSVGEKGIVSYLYKGMNIEFNAEIIACPTEGSGDFIALLSGDTNNIPENYPGKFSIIVFKEDNSLLIPKNAVFPLDEKNAIVLQIDEKGTLVEKNIVIGQVNETHYQVIEGIDEGEKVVLRWWLHLPLRKW